MSCIFQTSLKIYIVSQLICKEVLLLTVASYPQKVPDLLLCYKVLRKKLAVPFEILAIIEFPTSKTGLLPIQFHFSFMYPRYGQPLNWLNTV